MSNGLISNQMITNEALTLAVSNCSTLNCVGRKFSDDVVRVNGRATGGVINVRMPNDIVINDLSSTGGDLTGIEASNFQERSIPVTLNTVQNAFMQFSEMERRTVIQNFSNRYIDPAVERLLPKVNADVIGALSVSGNNFVRNSDQQTGKTLTPSLNSLGQVRALLSNSLAPKARGYSAIMSEFTHSDITASMGGYFNPASEISAQFRTGKLKNEVMGIDRFVSDQSIITQTTGSYDGKATATGSYGAPSGSPTLDPKISTSNAVNSCEIGVSAINGTINAGDFITIEGVYAINRATGASLGYLQHFSVSQNAASGATSLVVSPAIIGPDAQGKRQPNQTVSAVPASGAAITPMGLAGETTYRNIILHPEAATLVNTYFDLATSGPEGSAPNVQIGNSNYYNLSLTTSSTRDFMKAASLIRMDILYGIAILRPEWIAILASPAG